MSERRAKYEAVVRAIAEFDRAVSSAGVTVELTVALLPHDWVSVFTESGATEWPGREFQLLGARITVRRTD